MREGQSNRNLTQLEKQAGQRAARTLRRNLKNVLKANTESRSGTMLRAAGASVRMKFDALDSIALKASSVTFMQHYGFEGVKSNGVRMTMKPYDHFGALFDKTNALKKLANEVGELRAEEVITKVTNILDLNDNGRK